MSFIKYLGKLRKGISFWLHISDQKSLFKLNIKLESYWTLCKSYCFCFDPGYGTVDQSAMRMVGWSRIGRSKNGARHSLFSESENRRKFKTLALQPLSDGIRWKSLTAEGLPMVWNTICRGRQPGTSEIMTFFREVILTRLYSSTVSIIHV